MTREELQKLKNRYGLVGFDPAFENALQQAVSVAIRDDIRVFIYGETGVGKESIARIIHDYSPRKKAKFVAINCGAIPEGTIDSELFGHEKGAFTGADDKRKGFFEEANNGTIFLDEIGDMPFSTQSRLLRVLQNGELYRVGSSVPQRIDVRVIAATNVDMFSSISRGKFRSDLYYRLSQFPIHVPALRERSQDIKLLFVKFASDIISQYTDIPEFTCTPEGFEELQKYAWPGNIRQLKNVAEQIAIIETERQLTPDIIKKYLPEIPTSTKQHLPILYNTPNDFNSEYTHQATLQLIYQLRQEVNDLRNIVNSIVIGSTSTNIGKESISHTNYPTSDNRILGNSPLYIPDKTNPYHNENEHEIEDVDPETIETSNTGIEENRDTSSNNLSLDKNEKALIIAALKKNKNNRRKTALDLGISTRTLYRKINDYGL